MKPSGAARNERRVMSSSPRPTSEAWAIDRLSVWAVRYALGRATYAVGDVVDALIAQHTALSPSSKRAIIADIEAAFASRSVGQEMDRHDWTRLRTVLTTGLDDA